MNKPRLTYCEKNDLLHLAISDEPKAGSIEISPAMTVELDGKGELIGIEIRSATSFVYNSSMFPIVKQRNLRISQEYYRVFKEFRDLTGYASSLSYNTTGVQIEDWEMCEASLIFGKLCMHAHAILRLAPYNNQVSLEDMDLWDLASICAITRCLIDAYNAMYYLSIDGIDAEERSFRRCLWDFHAKKGQFDILNLAGSKDPRVSGLEAEVDRLCIELTSDPFYMKLDSETQKKARKGKLAFHLSNSEISKRAGIQPKHYKSTYDWLSNHIHTYAFSVSQLGAFRIGNPESLECIGVSIQHASAYLALAIRDFTKVMPTAPAVPEEIGTLISRWEHIVGSPKLVNNDSDNEMGTTNQK